MKRIFNFVKFKKLFTKKNIYAKIKISKKEYLCRTIEILEKIWYNMYKCRREKRRILI